MRISPSTIVLESCSNPQKTWQVFASGMKKFFGCGFVFFVSDIIKWSSFTPFWPTSSGPRPKLLDDSVSLKFLL